MKICSITIYMNDLADEEINYTAIMKPGGYVGQGCCPQEAISNLPEAIANHILRRPHAIESADVEAAEHWLCEPDQSFPQWVEEAKVDRNWRCTD